MCSSPKWLSISSLSMSDLSKPDILRPDLFVKVLQRRYGYFRSRRSSSSSALDHSNEFEASQRAETRAPSVVSKLRYCAG